MKGRAALEQIIKEQKALGATVSERLTGNGDYEWDEDGNLIEVFWKECSLSGEVSFSDFPQLERLYCWGNELTGLDVTQNKELEVLECYDNKLTELDVTHNTVLKEFYCDNNRLTYLDVTNNTILEEFACGENELTYLDLTHNRHLKNMDSVGNDNLETVDLSEDSRYLWYQHDSWTTLNYYED